MGPGLLFDCWRTKPHDCLFWPLCRRQSAISIGQAENLPALAFSVRFRRYPPGLLIMALRCTIAASATHASSAPITSVASAQALGLMPKAPRTEKRVGTLDGDSRKCESL